MSTESSSLNRRHFLTLGAAAGAGIVVATALPEAGAVGVVQAAAPAPIKPKPLADKVYTTEAAGISRKTHDEHFKLYTGYVNKVNEIRTKLAALGVPDPTKANATFSDLRELKVEYSFALGGVKNHELYFGHLGGKGGAPNGAIADAINTTFGSYDNWKADLKATGIAARGWVWMALDYTDGSLFNYIGDAQNSFPIWNAAPLLALDVYEHAYFIDFGSARAKYIDAFLNVIDWDAVNANFAVAQTMLKAGK
jgi:Fe-Mn family superoxide dismutase